MCGIDIRTNRTCHGGGGLVMADTKALDEFINLSKIYCSWVSQ
jgi:hypothetical protein